MKSILILGLLASYSFSQGNEVEMIREYIVNDRTIGPSARMQMGRDLENSLSSTLKTRITKKSLPFRLDMGAIRKLVEAESDKKNPNLQLKIDLFNEGSATKIEIASISESNGRKILTGAVKEKAGSHAQFVYFENSLVGRITFEGNPHVILIQGGNDGIAGSFEIDATDINYD